jgi:hypothetical protein
MKSKEKKQAGSTIKPSISSLQVFVITICVALLAVFIYRYASPGPVASPPADVSGSQAINSPSPPAVYFTPKFQTYTGGTSFVVEVRENSGTTPVNAVQANFSYPEDKLSLVKIDTSASPFTISAQTNSGNGMVSVARGTTGSLAGDKLVAKAIFKVNSTPGTANLAFTSGTALVSSLDNKNLITSEAFTGAASYTIQ